jgi:hypothetical protein
MARNEKVPQPPPRTSRVPLPCGDGLLGPIRPSEAWLLRLQGTAMSFTRADSRGRLSLHILSVLYRLIRDLQPAINNRKRLAQLHFINAKRRIGEERVPAHQRVESLLAEEAPEGGHLV